MKALIVVSEAPPIMSGVSRSVDRLSRGLRDLGIEVDVLSSNDIRRWTLGEVRISSLAAHWPSLSRAFERYDVINLHGPAPTMSDLFLALFRTGPSLTRPALVYTHHSSIDIAGLTPLCRLYNSATARLACLADRVVVTTNSYAREIRRTGGPEIDIVPWGVDSAPLSHRTRRLHEPLRVLFVGQLRPYKGISVLLQAVAGQPQLTLTVVGSGPLEARHQQEAAALSATNVVFVGQVTDSELQRLYADHDVIVLPSTTRAEGFGLVLLEGMASGCVPVASDLLGVRDVAGPTGVLVNPGDAASLRDGLLALAQDPERVQRLAAASRAAAEQLPWGGVAAFYARTFRAAIDDVKVRRGSALLPLSFSPPEAFIAPLARRFDASWWSLMVFHGKPTRPAPIAWGRAADRLVTSGSAPVAEYVAQFGRAVLLDPDEGDGDLRRLLTRSDVRSAMAVPFQLRKGALGVLSLSVAANATRSYCRRDLEDFASLVTP
jgi:glycosyltransferase involved in cell wall biosynthesis